MTVLEQRFMERVPNLLHDIAKSLEAIAEEKTNRTVYVVTVTNDCLLELPNVSVNVFGTLEEARKCLLDEWVTLTAGQKYADVSKKTDDDFLFEASATSRTIGEIKEVEVKL